MVGCVALPVSCFCLLTFTPFMAFMVSGVFLGRLIVWLVHAALFCAGVGFNKVEWLELVNSNIMMCLVGNFVATVCCDAVRGSLWVSDVRSSRWMANLQFFDYWGLVTVVNAGIDWVMLFCWGPVPLSCFWINVTLDLFSLHSAFARLYSGALVWSS